MIKQCPNCHQFYVIPEHTGDYLHQCNSGNNSLDKEDVLKIDNPNWNLQGVENGASVAGRVIGVDVENINVRGKIKTLYKERQYFEYIK